MARPKSKYTKEKKKRNQLYKTIWWYAKRHGITFDESAKIKGVSYTVQKFNKYEFKVLSDKKVKTSLGTVMTKAHYEFRKRIGRCVECGVKIQNRFGGERELCYNHGKRLAYLRSPKKKLGRPKKVVTEPPPPKPVINPPEGPRIPVERLKWENGVLVPIEQ